MAEQWSGSDKSASITVSGSRSEIATNTVGGAHALVRGTTSSTGKLYFESVQSSIFGVATGFATSSAPTNDAVGGGSTSGNSVGTYNNNGVLFNGSVDNTGTYAGGDQLAHAIDQSAGKYWWKDLTSAGAWQPSGDPSAGTGGFTITGNITSQAIFPAASIFNINDTATGYWKTGDITGTVPTGFSLFDPAVTFRRSLAGIGTRTGSRQLHHNSPGFAAPGVALPPVSGRNFLLGVYNYTRGGTQTPYHSKTSAGPTASGLALGYKPDHDEQYQDHTPGGAFSSLTTTYPHILSVDLYNQGTHMTYADIAAGTHDADIDATFNSAKTKLNGKIYYFMLDKEFNFDSQYITDGATTYKAAINRVVARGKAIFGTGAGSPKYFWNPNYSAGGDISAYAASDVDGYGIDAYTNTSFSTTWAQLFGNTNGTDAGTLWWWTKLAQTNGKAMAICEGGDASNAGTPDANYYNALFDWALNVTTGTWVGASADNNVVDITLYEAGTSANQSAANASVMSNAQQDALVNRLRTVTYTGSFFSLLTPDSSESWM